eukprot:2748252-Pleurochrysis_carterae.AAC.1
MPFNSRSKSATSAKKMRIDVALAVAVKVVDCSHRGPSALCVVRGTVAVKLVGEHPLGPADERVLWTLNQ